MGRTQARRHQAAQLLPRTRALVLVLPRASSSTDFVGMSLECLPQCCGLFDKSDQIRSNDVRDVGYVWSLVHIGTSADQAVMCTGWSSMTQIGRIDRIGRCQKGNSEDW